MTWYIYNKSCGINSIKDRENRHDWSAYNHDQQNKQHCLWTKCNYKKVHGNINTVQYSARIMMELHTVSDEKLYRRWPGNEARNCTIMRRGLYKE